MTDQNNTIARSIRMYPHEWEMLDKRCKQLNKELAANKEAPQGRVAVSRLLAVLTISEYQCKWYAPEDIIAYTKDARANDARRRKRMLKKHS
jgi:hypothetical protein